MTRRHFVRALFTVSLLAFAGAFAINRVIGADRSAASGAATPRTMAAWAYKTSDAKQMARDVDAIVVATWVGVSPGRVAYSSNSEDALAFELNDFNVEEVIKGRRLVGGSVMVERVATNQMGRLVDFDYDGGAFLPDTRYLLFLKKQPDTAHFIQINDEGRYVIDGRDQLLASGKGSVADTVSRGSIGQLRSLVQQALRQGVAQ